MLLTLLNAANYGHSERGRGYQAHKVVSRLSNSLATERTGRPRADGGAGACASPGRRFGQAGTSAGARIANGSLGASGLYSASAPTHAPVCRTRSVSSCSARVSRLVFPCEFALRNQTATRRLGSVAPNGRQLIAESPARSYASETDFTSVQRAGGPTGGGDRLRSLAYSYPETEIRYRNELPEPHTEERSE